MLKLLVLGLDGATFDVIEPLLEQGGMPNLRRLMDRGASGRLRSTLPPVTAPAWSTFMTGRDPGGHGVFQWRTYDPTTYANVNEKVVTSASVAGQTFWDVLGNNGQKVAVICVPITYPTWPVNGYLLSGYPCPDTKRNYTYPASWSETLPQSYNFSADYFLNASEEEVLSNGLAMLQSRTDMVVKLVQKEPLDALVVVLGETDRAQHDFWSYRDPRFSGFHSPRAATFGDAIDRHYEVSDAQLGRMLELTDENTFVLVMSDHGGGPHPMRQFYPNAWLRDMGYLHQKQENRSLRSRVMQWLITTVRRVVPFEDRLRRLLPARIVEGARSVNMGLDLIDWGQTQAYHIPMYHPAAGVEINLMGRQPEGIVAAGAEADALREELIEQLREVRDPDTGEAVVTEIYRREEIYDGPYLEIAPDIVYVTGSEHYADSGLPRQWMQPSPLAEMTDYFGVHTMDGILIAAGPGVRPASDVNDATICDIAPTVLYATGHSVPEHMTGRVLESIFSPEYLVDNPISQEAISLERKPVVGHSEQEEEDMLNKLRGLGYVD